MFAVILTAGRGTRMGDLTKNTQKTMLLINGKPKLAYTVENLPDEITDVIFIVNYLQEQVREYFGSEYQGLKIHYVEQKELNGTGEAILLTKDIIRDKKFLVLYGDDLYRKEDLEKLLPYNYAVLGFQTDEAERFGLIGEDEDGYAKSIVEKPHGQKVGLVNMGAYIVSPEYFDTTQVYWSKEESGLPQTLAAMYPKYKTKIIKTKKWQPIGTPEEFEIAKERINEFVG